MIAHSDKILTRLQDPTSQIRIRD